MKANIESFSSCSCPNASENKQTHVVRVDDVILSSQEGAYINRQLWFNTHINNKCAKANSKLQALKRLMHFFTGECKLAVLGSFIVSHVIYCAPLFHFGSKPYRDKMEKIIFRGLRCVFNDYESSYEKLLKKLKMCSVEVLLAAGQPNHIWSDSLRYRGLCVYVYVHMCLVFHTVCWFYVGQ